MIVTAALIITVSVHQQGRGYTTVACSHSGVLGIQRKELPTHAVTGTILTHSVEQKMSDTKRVYTLWFCLYKVLTKGRTNYLSGQTD